MHSAGRLLSKVRVSLYGQLQEDLRKSARSWLITGAAGFIGSNLLEALLKLDQTVVGLDDLSTGRASNLAEVQTLVSAAQWRRFTFIEGDVVNAETCRRACEGADYVLHQAALGSVPRSIVEPLASHECNVTGFLNMLIAARDQRVKRFVYASSSAVYGDDQELPKMENKIGRPLSPYAATKLINEVYADAFAASYQTESIGLRYFNVFGPRQDPNGAYAAVIPKWIDSLLAGQPVVINGDGQTSRDFCFAANVVQANLLAATTPNPAAVNHAYNIGVGKRTTLNELFLALDSKLRQRDPSLPKLQPVYKEFRSGDVLHSLADISKARRLLGFEPEYLLDGGLDLALDWYRANSKARTD